MILQNLAGIEDYPAHLAIATLRQLAYPAPWGLPAEGQTADVEQLSIDAVRQFVARHVRPQGTIIAAAGRLDWDDFVRRIDALLGDWETAAPVEVTTRSRGPRMQHVLHDSQQTNIALAW